MKFCDRSVVSKMLEGKSVAIVGSGPSSLENAIGFVDSHQVVVRANNYKTGPRQGLKTHVFYSFFGRSIKKKKFELQRDGVKLCMCKCPNAKFIESDWHDRNGKYNGVDFRYIYALRKGFWFCDTYVPTVDEFMRGFNLLNQHVPTTGFSALLDVLSYNPRSVYMTGFDFFRSGIHNVNEPWKKINNDDPIGHVPELELQWLKANYQALNIKLDKKLLAMVNEGSE